MKAWIKHKAFIKKKKEVTESTLDSVSTHREGAENTPRARIALSPKLARSFWSDTVKGKFLRKTGGERERDRGSGTGKSAFG
jgi:hypothetical protein